jgi:hypothetical protein
MNQKKPAPGVPWTTLQYNVRRAIETYDIPEIMATATDIFTTLNQNKCMFTDGEGKVRFISPADLEAAEEEDEEM